jgi:cell shape-determining protein MreC
MSLENILLLILYHRYSTTFRPFRHTATVVALNLVLSLSEFAAETQEELNVSNRQLSTSQRQKAAATKVKQLQKKVTEAQARKTQVLKWIDEIFVRYVPNHYLVL